MQQYPEPDQHLRQHMQQAAKKHGKWIAEQGMEPTPTLLKAIADVEFERARDNFITQTGEIHQHNVAHIMRNHNRRLNEIKRQGATLRRKTCPPIALVLALFAWFAFSHSQPALGWMYAGAALIFIGMLVYGELFDRPHSPRL